MSDDFGFDDDDEDDEPYEQPERYFRGLVTLGGEGNYRACILELDAEHEHRRALVFLDAWEAFPRFGFVYLKDDVPIEWASRQNAWPILGETQEMLGSQLGTATPGTIFLLGGMKVLWVINHDGTLYPLPLMIAMDDHYPGFRQFCRWEMGNRLSGNSINRVAFVQAASTDSAKGDDPRGWEDAANGKKAEGVQERNGLRKRAAGHSTGAKKRYVPRRRPPT